MRFGHNLQTIAEIGEKIWGGKVMENLCVETKEVFSRFYITWELICVDLPPWTALMMPL